MCTPIKTESVKVDQAGSPVDVPDAHSRSRYTGELNGAGETLIALGIIIFQADLEFDRFEEVSLLLVEGVVQQRLHVCAHSGCRGTWLALVEFFPEV